jgi:hypothetical protein
MVRPVGVDVLGYVMGDYRERCNEAKAKRAGIVDQRPVNPVARKDKPVIVECRRHLRCQLPESLITKEWRKWNRYRTVEEAERAMALQRSKLSDLWEFRIR